LHVIVAIFNLLDGYKLLLGGMEATLAIPLAEAFFPLATVPFLRLNSDHLKDEDAMLITELTFVDRQALDMAIVLEPKHELLH
jgi:hypothetical protein